MVQPSLLDRLTDDSPGTASEVADASTYSLARLRQVILRDISWLLNADALELSVDLTTYPEVMSSTLNYGAPALDGLEREGLDLYALRQSIARSLRRFESRLMPDSIEVSTVSNEGAGSAVHIRIVADLWAQPMPLRMIMRTEIDPETPTIRVVECRGEGEI
ncbi:type VI secretion system baseplate subunit TssE [Thalassococcus sp. S3]|uniref:type VI secretion system baseplate subunit TssE n=1 Tax=Thalassococcus sp. S3 TaxID=2017482 RepID=UPI001C2BA067|nr:type VI secretion system baseplate subunit TssE [Thalassococcus sp. S3]